MIKGDLILFIAELGFCVLLFILAHFAEKYISSKWRICYLIPAVFCLIFTALGALEICMLGVYIGSAVNIAGFFCEKKKIRQLASGIAAALILTALPASLLYSGYRAASYTEDFKTAFAKMKDHYILAEHKGVDWDALYDEYLTKFRSAEENNDEIENFIYWLEFSSEFRDGHVGYAPDGDYEEISTKAFDRIFGNDYGLSLMSLSDGSVAAVNVDPSLNGIGIKNGTIVTSWDGKDPVEIGKDYTKYSPIAFADKDNEYFYRALYAAGVGGDTVTVAYLDDSGNEKTAELQKMGVYYSDRMKKTLEVIDGGLDVGHFEWVELDDKTVAIRMKMMMYDRDSSKSNDYSVVRNVLVTNLREYIAQGYENLILDMRGNSGGAGEMVKAIAEVVAPEGEHYYCTDGLWDKEAKKYAYNEETGKFYESTKNYYTGTGFWKGKVIILVNSNSISAADHTVEILSDFDNITIMGFTESNGSAQGIGGVYLNHGMFQFSSSLLLDENGNVSVDSGIDYESGNDIEIKVPFDSEAIEALFENDRDYLIDKAIEELSK